MPRYRRASVDLGNEQAAVALDEVRAASTADAETAEDIEIAERLRLEGSLKVP